MADLTENSFYYKETKYSGRGIAATAIGACSMVAYIVLAILAVHVSADAMWIGAFGFTAFAAAFVGMVIGLNSFKDHCRSYVFCKIGTIYCGLMVAVWFLTACVGLAAN